MSKIQKLIEQGKFKEAETLVVESKVSKKTEEAINCGEALLLSGYQGDASLYFMLGTCYSWIEQYDKAIEAYNQVIKLKPDYAKAHHNLGYAYTLKGEYSKAIEAFHQALELDPDCVSAYYNLGNVYSIKEDYSKAIEAYKEAIKLRPTHAEAHHNLGNVHQINKWLKENYPNYANLSEEDKRVVRQQYNQEKYAEANKS